MPWESLEAEVVHERAHCRLEHQPGAEKKGARTDLTNKKKELLLTKKGLAFILQVIAGGTFKLIRKNYSYGPLPVISLITSYNW